MSSKAQPKILQKMLLRTLGLIIVMGALLLGYQWMRNRGGDFDIAPAKTVGWTLALKIENDGQRAVAIKPDGTIVENTGWVPGVTDRDLVWQPDGNRAFFVSDRQAKDAKPGVTTLNIFRWNPEANKEPDQRTLGSRGRSDIAFPLDGGPGPQTALITSGGFVLEFDSDKNATRQVLPPIGNEVATSNDEGASTSTSQFTAFYNELGTSFRTARWLREKSFVAAIMRQEDGEILIVQDMRPSDDGKFKKPALAAAGERIDMAVDPITGGIVFSVANFRFPDPNAIPPQFRQGNKVITPFKNALFKFDPETALQPPIVASNDIAFGSPAINPDGAQVVCVIGKFLDGALSPELLAVFPNQSGGAGAQATLAEGKVFEPTWTKDGAKLLFVKALKDERSIFEINRDGSDEKNLTAGKGKFAFPRPSPQ
ncbi:hypothetical protein EON81_18555 [bacterium]|nr:MAG: hypothetical protein EON81_18555 [bacterium]